jgi:hypothetical protein
MGTPAGLSSPSQPWENCYTCLMAGGGGNIPLSKYMHCYIFSASKLFICIYVLKSRAVLSFIPQHETLVFMFK